MLNAHCVKVVLGTIALVDTRKLCTLCIVKCVLEDRKLVFQMRNKIFSTTMSRTKMKQQENTWIYIQNPSIPGQKESLI